MLLIFALQKTIIYSRQKMYSAQVTSIANSRVKGDQEKASPEHRAHDTLDGGCCTQIVLMGQQTRYMDRVT
jgi:hypothetical protein